MAVYINGELGDETPSVRQLETLEQPLSIGHSLANGVLDEVWVYNEALTATQVSEHFELGVIARD